jgi:hypothetical protein
MSLYVAGYGNVSHEELAVRQVCRDHDADLVFQRSQRTGNYTIFQRLMRDSAYVRRWEEADLEEGNLFPVREFPHGRIPGPDEVGKWLYEHDQNRFDLLTEINKRNGKRLKEIDDHFQDQAHGAAVRMEHMMRKLGEDTGVTISMPNDGKRRRTPKLPD